MDNNQKSKMYFYESFAEDFDSKMNMYDTNKRLKVVYGELLTEDIAGKLLLDAGCGTGWFSKFAADRGAVVTSMDLGENLLAQVALKCETKRVVGSILEIPFPDNTFDFVVSSEVIEHVPDPYKAIQELYRVLKPGGTIVLTTPNKIWYFAIWIANTFKLRPYQGLENWTGWYKMKKNLKNIGFSDVQLTGIHLFPFVSKIIYPILDFFHRFNKVLGPVMLNIAVKAKKPDSIKK
ncbi:MAG: class I SAM-dependent methyltransferase [Tenuifilaceae bacterium]